MCFHGLNVLCETEMYKNKTDWLKLCSYNGFSYFSPTEKSEIHEKLHISVHVLVKNISWFYFSAAAHNPVKDCLSLLREAGGSLMTGGNDIHFLFLSTVVSPLILREADGNLNSLVKTCCRQRCHDNTFLCITASK